MKKKILPFLLFFLLLHRFHPVAKAYEDPIALDNSQEELEEADTYLPPVENYPSFMIDFLKMDYLYNLDSKKNIPFNKIKKINYNSLLRLNAAALYAIRICHSRFSICIGIGSSSLYYAFSGQNRGGDIVYPTLKRKDASHTDCRDLENKQGKKYSYSAIEIPFIDFLLRVRFNTVLNEPKEGFHTWLGVKLGLRRPASTITHYTEYDDPGASSVSHGNFNLNRCAFGLQAGIGYHRFGLIGGFHLTPLFQEEKGPAHANLLRPFSLAIYVDLI